MTVPCLLDAWSAHEAELLRYLRHHIRPSSEAEDVLHDLFLKALRQGERFCAVNNPRAWLFEVARNVVVDRARGARSSEPLPEDLVSQQFFPAVWERIAQKWTEGADQLLHHAEGSCLCIAQVCREVGPTL